MNVLEYGQITANPNKRDSENLVEVAKCDSFAANPCKDSGSATLGGGVSVTGFTFNGVAVTLDSAIAVTDPAAIQKAIEDHIAKTHFNVYVRVEYTGGDLIIKHIGQGTLSAVAHDTPGSIALTRECTVISLCEYAASIEGDAGPIGDGTSTSALANTPYNYSGTPATDATTAGTLKTDMETALTALSVDYESVAVTVDDTLGAFLVVVNAKKNTVIYNGTNRFQESNCKIDFE